MCIRLVDLGFVDYAIMKDGNVYTVICAYWYDVEIMGQFSSRGKAHKLFNQLLEV